MEEVADSAEWDDGPTFGAANPMAGARRGSDSKAPFDVEDAGLRRASAPERVPTAAASRGDALRRDVSALDREVLAVLSKRPTPPRARKRQTVMGKAWHAAVTALVEREKEEIALRAWETAIDFGSTGAGLSIYLVAAVTESRRKDMGKCIFLVVLRAGKGCEIPNFKGSYLGRFPLVLADFWTSDHLSERSRP